MDGKAALITGGTRGIGRAIAEILLEQGANVCIFDVVRHSGHNTERDLQRKFGIKRVFFFLGDVTNQNKMEAAMKQTIARFGGLDILVNNAAISNERDIRKSIDVNLTGVILTTMLGLKYMGKAAGRPGGNVINVASVAGFLPSPQVPIYTSVKHGVVGFSRALGKVAPRLYDIRVNCLCPTFVDTDMLRDKGSQNWFDGQKAMGAWMTNMHDKVGIMTVREVAEVFMKLLQNDKLSGEIMLVSTKAKGVVAMPKRLEEAVALCKI